MLVLEALVAELLELFEFILGVQLEDPVTRLAAFSKTLLAADSLLAATALAAAEACWNQ